MDKDQIARALEEIALLLELTGANPFKVRAYRNASRIVEGLSDDLDKLIERDELTKLKGIGRNLADHIAELARTGKVSEYDKLKKSVPSGVIEMLSIPGLGAKRVSYIWRERHITTVGELELYCSRHMLADAPGFGAKTEKRILAGIDMLKRFAGKRRLDEALAQADAVLESVRSWPKVERAEIAGSIRRCRELIGDIDIIVTSGKPAEVMERFVSMPGIERVVQHGDKKSEVILGSGMQCDLRVFTGAEFPFALHHFTGSKEHNVHMRRLAKGNGLKLNEYGLFKIASDTSASCRDEGALFKRFGMDYIEPELREDMGEIEAAARHELPELIESSDLRGIVHVHSDYSDGEASIEGMALASQAMGCEYLAICDHSQSLTIARGMKPGTVRRQHAEIDELNKRLEGFRVLKGIEVDILADGSLDYDDELLASFDIVIAAVHSRFAMSEEDMTARIVKGISNRNVHALAHPTGRLLLARDPYAVDLPRVIDVAAERGVALEINSHPQRLDLDWRWCKQAKAAGAKFLICPDAHSPEDLTLVRFGLSTARKGWLEKSDVLNCLGAGELLKRLKSRNG